MAYSREAAMQLQHLCLGCRTQASSTTDNDRCCDCYLTVTVTATVAVTLVVTVTVTVTGTAAVTGAVTGTAHSTAVSDQHKLPWT